MADKQWYVAVDGKSIGPMSEGELKDAIRAGTYGADHHVFSEGMKGWVPVHSVSDFHDVAPWPE